MKNKKLLYGLLGIGAIAGFYFWNKNKKSVTNVVTDEAKKSGFSNEEIEKLSKEFADEFVSEAKKQITNIELAPIEPKVEVKNNFDVLTANLEKYREDFNKTQKKQKFQKLANSYGSLYKSFKKSIPNFDSLADLTMAKNILLKYTILGYNQNILTKDEQIFLANSESNKAIMKYPETLGFDMSDVFPKDNKAEQKKIGNIFLRS